MVMGKLSGSFLPLIRFESSLEHCEVHERVRETGRSEDCEVVDKVRSTGSVEF